MGLGLETESGLSLGLGLRVGNLSLRWTDDHQASDSPASQPETCPESRQEKPSEERHTPPSAQLKVHPCCSAMLQTPSLICLPLTPRARHLQAHVGMQYVGRRNPGTRPWGMRQHCWSRVCGERSAQIRWSPREIRASSQEGTEVRTGKGWVSQAIFHAPHQA